MVDRAATFGRQMDELPAGEAAKTLTLADQFAHITDDIALTRLEGRANHHAKGMGAEVQAGHGSDYGQVRQCLNAT